MDYKMATDGDARAPGLVDAPKVGGGGGGDGVGALTDRPTNEVRVVAAGNVGKYVAYALKVLKVGDR